MGVPWLGQSLEMFWQSRDYDILRKNCMHFAEDMCSLLQVSSMPEQVSRLARALERLERLGEALDGSLAQAPGCCTALGLCGAAVAGAVSGASASPPGSPTTFSLEWEEPGLSAAVCDKGAPKAVAAASVSLFDATTRPCSPASAP